MKDKEEEISKEKQRACMNEPLVPDKQGHRELPVESQSTLGKDAISHDAEKKKEVHGFERAKPSHTVTEEVEDQGSASS